MAKNYPIIGKYINDCFSLTKHIFPNAKTAIYTPEGELYLNIPQNGIIKDFVKIRGFKNE